MKRRGYLISAAVICVDLLLFPFGGFLIAAAALIYVLGVGGYIARKQCGAISCDQSLGVKHCKLNRCYNHVKEKTEQGSGSFPQNVRVYVIPGEEMNGYCFGFNSIGITEGTLNLDEKTVEAVIAHEIGHIVNGDSVLNMVLAVNVSGILLFLGLWQFFVIAMISLVVFVFWMIGEIRFSFTSCFIVTRLTALVTRLSEGFQAIVLRLCQMVISALSRKGEYMADTFAANLGYAFYLKHFLERFAPDSPSGDHRFFHVVYDTHPSTASRVERLEQYRSSRRVG